MGRALGPIYESGENPMISAGLGGEGVRHRSILICGAAESATGNFVSHIVPRDSIWWQDLNLRPLVPNEATWTRSIFLNIDRYAKRQPDRSTHR